MTEEAVDEFLAHYGVKGMHWGVRKEEKSSSSTPSQSRLKTRLSRPERIKKFEAREKQAQTAINKLEAKQPRTRYGKKVVREQIAELKNDRNEQRRNIKAAKEGKFTERERKRLVGASATAAILAAYGTYKFIDSGEAHRLSVKGKAFVAKEAFSWRKNPNLIGDKSVDGIMSDVVSHINPDYGKYGTKMNCRRATFAYEMRRRGYDVKATKSSTATGQTPLGLISATTPNAKVGPTGKVASLIRFGKETARGGGTFTESMKSGGGLGKEKIGEGLLKLGTSEAKSSTIFEALGRNPNGSRGELTVGWNLGGGHSMAWEVIQGKPVIFDAQSGTAYKDFAEFNAMATNVATAGFTRLDNVPLNDNFLMRWVTNVK